MAMTTWKFDGSAFWSGLLGGTVVAMWLVGMIMWSVHSDATRRAATAAEEKAVELADAPKPEEVAKRAAEHQATIEGRRVACLKDGGSLLKPVNGSAEQFDTMVICLLPAGKAASLWPGDVLR